MLSRGYQEFPQHFPQPGWVEHEPEEIWQAVLRSLPRGARGLPGAPHLRSASPTSARRPCCGTARRCSRRAARSSGRTGAPPASASGCSEAGHEPRVAELTGLRLDPYFTATKLAWLAEHEPARLGRASPPGRTAVGTVDSYLVARLTGGAAHVTDAEQRQPHAAVRPAHRRLVATSCASCSACRSRHCPRSSRRYGEVGRTDPAAFLGLDLPIAGIAGDQQAALFGQGCYDPGAASAPTAPARSCWSTPAARPGAVGAAAHHASPGCTPTARSTYALEGAVFVTGAAVQWLRDGLQLIGSAQEIEALARQVPDSGGVVFVPALTGLGAPHWDPDARGTVLGITRGTTRAHLARATLDAIAFEVRDVVDAMTAEAGVEVPTLQVDGGARPTTCCASCRPTSSASPCSGPRCWRRRRWARPSSPGLGTACGQPARSSPTPGGSTAASSRRPGCARTARHARWLRAVERARGWED